MRTKRLLYGTLDEEMGYSTEDRKPPILCTDTSKIRISPKLSVRKCIHANKRRDRGDEVVQKTPILHPKKIS